jgi:hypothetical protein
MGVCCYDSLPTNALACNAYAGENYLRMPEISNSDGADGAVHRYHQHPRRKGRPLSPERCAKISAALKGKPKSPEHRAKLSATKSGKNHQFFGKALSPKHRAKISAANKGKQHSPETRAKISAAAKERESRKRLLLSAPAPAPEQAIQSVLQQ